MLPNKLRFIKPTRFRLEDFSKSTNQKQELPMPVKFATDLDKISNLYRGPTIDASYQFLLIWPSGLRGEHF
jgi:hypothetical protein